MRRRRRPRKKNSSPRRPPDATPLLIQEQNEIMSEDTLAYLWNNYMHRFLAEGANYRDLLDLRQRIAALADWPTEWSQLARTCEERAGKALAAGFTHTAGGELARA